MNEISFDKETDILLDKLKKDFGVSTRAQVIRKSLGLANLAAKYSDDNHILTLISPDGKEIEIRLNK